MNKQRAQQIAASPVMADVTYNGSPIYIQHVDEENDTARVYPLDRPEDEQTVPLSSLTENGAAPTESVGPLHCPLTD